MLATIDVIIPPTIKIRSVCFVKIHSFLLKKATYRINFDKSRKKNDLCIELYHAMVVLPICLGPDKKTNLCSRSVLIDV